MNFKIQKLTVAFFLFSSIGVFSQIKEEQLILDKKRIPEVKKIDKKKTSVENIKNYPPEEKSQVPVMYDIKNVPALSDFQTSTLQADDISPVTTGNYQKNYIQFGLGNYAKVLADANLSYDLENNMEVGGDAHVISTHGLKEDFPWDSRQSKINVNAFINGYGEKGKYNVDAGFDQENYNYYGIYALTPDSDIDIKQKVNQFQVNAFYDHFSNNVLNDVRFKSSFLTDDFKATENKGALDINLSKHALEIPLDGITLNADLGLKAETTNTKFEILDQNEAHYFAGSIAPKVTFQKGDSYVMIGSEFTFLNTKESSLLFTGKANKTYWFPKAEVQLSASQDLNLYAGVNGGLTINSYGEMLRENPYLVSDQRILPTETKYKVYFGLRGDIGEMVKYDVAAGYSKINNILFSRSNNLFDSAVTANRAPYDYGNTFSAVYDNGSKNEVTLSLQYFPLENLSLDGEFNYTSYKLENYDEIYNIPKVSAQIGAKYTALNKKLLLGAVAYLSSNTTINSFAFSNDGISSLYNSLENKNDTSSGNVDLNLSAEYKIHKNFSIFALGNNLIGTKYSNYQGYDVLGTQIVGGVKISF